MHRSVTQVFFSFTLVLLLTSCGATATAPATTSAPAATGAPAATTASGTGSVIRAVTTMSILADMINRVGGERVQATNIIPIGAGPEDYQPTPEDARKIATANIIFYNGFGLEAWLNDLFASAGDPSVPRVEAAKGLTPIDVGSADFAEGNPHLWMSAANGIKYVENIRDALIALDPASTALFTANAQTYIQELTVLDAELKQQAASIPEGERKLVTNHDAFPYFAQEYGFTIVGNILSNPEAEPSAGELAELVSNIKAQNVKAVFSESQFSPKLSQTIADEAGVSVVSNLYTDTLGDNSSGAGSYADMLRYDMTTIVDALK